MLDLASLTPEILQPSEMMESRLGTCKHSVVWAVLQSYPTTAVTVPL